MSPTQKYMATYILVGLYSSVGIATRYGLDSPGIEFRSGRDFPQRFRPAIGSNQPPVQWVPNLSRGVMRPEHGVVYPPQSSADVKERVELYIYSHSGLSWPILEQTLHLVYVYFYIFTAPNDQTP